MVSMSTRQYRIRRSALYCLLVLFLSLILLVLHWTGSGSNVEENQLKLQKDDQTHKVSFAPAVIITENKLQSPEEASIVNGTMQERLKHIHDKCAAGWKPAKSDIFRKQNLFYYDLRRKLAYCHAAKAGCTFWLRIFTYLTRKADLKYFGVISPFEIKRIHIHTGTMSPNTANTWGDFQKYIYDRSFRFLFTRNPYARLFSVYLDKYYLLGHSQSEFSEVICEGTLWLSFKMFLDLAMSIDDHHMIPISELCNPCEFKPHGIGKIETFMSDAQFILDRANYGSILRNFNHTFRVQMDMESIIYENFAFLIDLQGRFGEDCLSEEILCRRLWSVFQYNGYIPSSLNYPEEGLPLYSRAFVMHYFTELAKKHPLDAEESVKQKKRYLAEFYRDVSESIMIQIRKRYKGDFELFGYSPDVPKAD